jgi:hypothetical protein
MYCAPKASLGLKANAARGAANRARRGTLHSPGPLFAIRAPLKSAAQDKRELRFEEIKMAVAKTETKEMKTAAPRIE